MGTMSPLDAAMITGDVLLHPINIGAVLILAPPDDAGPDFADHLYRGSATSTAPVDRRLRRAAYRGPGTGGLWAWRDADPDLDHHLSRRTLPAGSGRDELWRLIGDLHSRPLDRSRPMWEAYLIDGLPDGRLAFYIKVHHILVDGVAGLQMITEGLTTDPARRDMPPFFAARPEAATRRSGGSGRNLFAPLQKLAGIAGSGVDLLRKFGQGQVRNALAVLSGETSIPAVGAPFTPFNHRLGPSRAVVGASWDKARIRAVQKATGTSAHDVVTSIVGGALRSWLADHDSLPGPSLVAICPITVRARDSVAGSGGNRFGAWLCPIGTDLTDPLQRLRRVHRSMMAGKRHVAQHGSGASLSLLVPSITSTIMQAVAPFGVHLRTGYNVPISSVPGPREERYWNGAHVEELYPVSAVFDGQTLNVTICSYAGKVGIGYVADADVMPDLATLVPRTEECLRELEAAVAARAKG